MKTRTTKSVSHQRGSTNVYADLGYKSADDMLVKAQLVTTIAEILAERGYTQTKAAEVLGIPQPKLSKMLRGQFRGIKRNQDDGMPNEIGARYTNSGRQRTAHRLDRSCRSHLLLKVSLVLRD